MHRAVILNNHGVVLLQQSNFAGAIQTLNDSLRLIDCAVECSKNENSNSNATVQARREASLVQHDNSTTDMTRQTVCILRMEEPVGAARGGRSNSTNRSDAAAADEQEEEEWMTDYEDHGAATGTRPVSVVPLTKEASQVMDVELVTSVIFFNISLSYATRASAAAAAQQQQLPQAETSATTPPPTKQIMMRDQQMALSLSETGWSILSGRLPSATNRDNFQKAEPYLAMAEKILHQIIELREQLYGACDDNDDNNNNAAETQSNHSTLCTYYDLLESVLRSLTMVDSIKDMELEAAAGAA
jgi:hypothetical protein